MLFFLKEGYRENYLIVSKTKPFPLFKLERFLSGHYLVNIVPTMHPDAAIENIKAATGFLSANHPAV